MDQRLQIKSTFGLEEIDLRSWKESLPSAFRTFVIFVSMAPFQFSCSDFDAFVDLSGSARWLETINMVA